MFTNTRSMIFDLEFFFDVPQIHDELECSMKKNAVKHYFNFF